MDLKRIKNNVPQQLWKQINWGAVENEIQNCYSNYGPLSLFIPRIYQLEITNFCNLKCNMCPYKKMTRKKQHMKFKLYKKIIDKDLYYKQAIELHLFGESTLHPEVAKMVKYAKNKGHIVGIATNATALTKEKSRSLLDAGLDNIVLALDGATKTTYEELRCGANFEIVKDNIKTFLKLKKAGNYNTYSVLQIIKMPKTKKEINNFKKEWQPFLRNGLDELRIKKLFDSLGGNVNPEIPVPNYKNRLPCTELWYGSAVLSNGDVVPCGRDYDGKKRFGNLNKQSLIEIFNSEKYYKFRLSHLTNNYKHNDLCRPCKEWDLINLRHVPILSCNLLKGDNTRYGQIVGDPKFKYKKKGIKK
ncbi:MAG: SPASM domain-containing protein [Candidatus ainarchaeum sp.]|nr:SPASM domain-containing protein [Candidatus ainarchaeum sp.]